MASPSTPRGRGSKKMGPISESGLYYIESQEDLDTYFQQMKVSSDEPSSPSSSSMSTSSSSFTDHLCRGFPMQLHVPEAFAAHEKKPKNMTINTNNSRENNNEYQPQMQFHVNENLKSPTKTPEDENRTLRFVGRRGLASGDGVDIKSVKGTVRGVKNRVRAGIANFEFKPLDNKKKTSVVNSADEVGRIIIYTTSVRIIRQTFEDCQYVRKVFQNHRVRFEERDLFMNAKHQHELEERLGTTADINLPICFIDGELVGDLRKLEELNESGELRRILKRFEKHNPMISCNGCGGHRYIPCTFCNGSKKSLLRNNWTDSFIALKCSYCDENGLQKCPECHRQ
ncbi:glutaredoxin domain-containing cysteine-rich protein 1 [Strongylocentrotus purpuratus]|uniref:Glutaredoxin domain-containing protein n=1 Tax=Strongylocentrotus purpuratus TaxID=7668 RepID=A0A7M7NH27_STRPU|nr:glutaredoxin domain-containing cysteine-rich protein 1 [Strongylocentrotus purpuratus]|eukprot:XP_011674003.1 PREDICTED: glutaredoxin domain-containing cysteine-rich protein 1 [Strongylocentrotus purpuratus]